MDLLTAVNRILPKLGEHPVTSLDTRHSTVAIILSAIDNQLDNISMRGWWFNEFKEVTLYTDVDSEILVPVGTYKFVPKHWYDRASVRNGKLFNGDTMTYVWPAAICGTITIKMPFNELPESAASYVLYSALVDTYITDIGLGDDVRAWSSESTSAAARMESEHLQQKKYSTRGTRQFANLTYALRA